MPFLVEVITRLRELLAAGIFVSEVQRVAVANLHANLGLDGLVHNKLLLSVCWLITAVCGLHPG